VKAADQQAAALAETFQKIYPAAHCELDFTQPLELLVATILSAQCTDVRVNLVTKALFQRFRERGGLRGRQPGSVGRGDPLHRLYREQSQSDPRHWPRNWWPSITAKCQPRWTP